MSDKFDELLDEYLKSDNNIDVEESVMSSIKMSTTSRNKNIKRVLTIAVLMIITMSVVFATSRFIFNDDGSVTMLNETEDKQWKMQPGNSEKAIKGKQWIALKELIDFLDEYPVEDDEIILGYLNYSDDTENNFFIRNEDVFYEYETFMKHKNLDPTFKKIIELFPEQFEYYQSEIRYQLTEDDFDYDSFMGEAIENAVQGEVYYKILQKPEKVGFTEIRYDAPIINNRKGFFMFTLSDGQYIFTSSSDNKSFETITYDHLEFLVERTKNNQVNVSTVYNNRHLLIRTELEVMSLEEIIDLMVNISYLIN